MLASEPLEELTPEIERMIEQVQTVRAERQHPNNRNAAIQAAFAIGACTMAQLAEHFQMHYTSVSQIVKLI